jgi:hypothetical protein
MAAPAGAVGVVVAGLLEVHPARRTARMTIPARIRVPFLRFIVG